MSIPAKFMEVARGRLDADFYNAIYERAVALERKTLLAPTSLSVDKPVVVERVAAHLNGEVKPVETPHILERLERRMDIIVTAADLGDLLKTALAGGPNVSVVKQTMDLVQECVVNWHGKHFVVVFSKSRGKLITAYAKPAKRKNKLKVGRPATGGRLQLWRTAMSEKPQCPECGHFVNSYFDHIHIDCEHDMTEEEIAELLREAEEKK